MPELIDLTGHRFGRWTVLRYDGGARWLCRCACGTERSVLGQKLRDGTSKSCRCSQRAEETRCSWCGRDGSEAPFGRARRICQACEQARWRRGRYPCGKPRRKLVAIELPREHVCAECERWPRRATA